MLSDHTKGFLFATLGALSAALFFIPYKKALETTDPQTFLLAVYIFGFVFSLVGSVAKKDTIKVNKSTLWGALIFAVLSVVGNYSIGRSLEGIDPAVTVLLTRTQIIIVLFLGWFFLKEQMVRFLIPGTLVTFAGFLMMNFDVADLTHSYYTSDGELSYTGFTGELVFYFWALTAALCFGSSQVILKSIIHKVEPVTLNFIRLLLGGVLICFFPGVISGIINITADIWLYAAASAFFGPLVSRLAYMYSVRFIPVSQSTLFIMLSPVFTAFFAWVFLDSLPTSQQVFGGLLVMSGVLMPVTFLLKSQNALKAHPNRS